MSVRKIFTIGETVFDILFKGPQPIAAKAGGSLLNASVSLGRLGLPVQLITEIGNDEVGKLILKFLNDNSVDAAFSDVFSEGNTALALAFLDAEENAHYTFYKNYPKKRLNIVLPDIGQDDLVLFGSFFAVSAEVRSQLVKFLKLARQAGAIIIYDPNIRESHSAELPRLKSYIAENIAFADIIRGSHEDFKFIFNTHSPDEVFREISEIGNKVLIYTAGANRVNFRSSRLSLSIRVPEIHPLSTIGAGDNFNAGVVYSLYKLKITRDNLSSLKKQEWQAIIDSGITFGTIVCESYDNYIPEAFAKKLRSMNRTA